MNTTEELYEAFISGELDTVPESVTNRTELAEFEKRLELSEEQRDELREVILDIACDYGKAMFQAGCALAANNTP